MKFGICNEMFVNMHVNDIIKEAAGLGFDGIELTPFTLSDDIPSFPVSEQKEIGKCALDQGIEVLGLHWILAKPEGLHISLPDPQVRAKTQDFFRKLIEIAVNTGAKILTLGSPDQRNYSEENPKEDAAQRMVDFFKELTPEFESAGITLALEPLEEEYTNFMTRSAEARDYADRIGSPAIGMTMDLHFMRWEYSDCGVDFTKAFETAGDRLSHIHIQDNNFLAPGTGTYDYTEFIKAVKAVSWDKYISVETFKVDEEGKGTEIARDSIAFFRKFFE